MSRAIEKLTGGFIILLYWCIFSFDLWLETTFLSDLSDRGVGPFHSMAVAHLVGMAFLCAGWIRELQDEAEVKKRDVEINRTHERLQKEISDIHVAFVTEQNFQRRKSP